MTRVALITWAGLPHLSPDDQLVAAALRDLGAEVVATVWSDAAVQWDEFDVAVLRSTWDYHKRPDEFAAWIDSLDRQRVNLWNPPAIVRVNTHKSYLLKLAGRGVNVVPTVLVPRGSATPLRHIMSGRRWERAVVKPAVSATAYRTFVASLDDEEPFQSLCADGDVLVQPFLPEIADRGEWSFVFFDGVFSHAAIKRPAAGEFRVQTDFGGTAEAAAPAAKLIEQAEQITRSIDAPWLYVRVDGVESGGGLLLMELELTEPWLFLGLHPEAPMRFARAILSRATAPR